MLIAAQQRQQGRQNLPPQRCRQYFEGVIGQVRLIAAQRIQCLVEFGQAPARLGYRTVVGLAQFLQQDLLLATEIGEHRGHRHRRQAGDLLHGGGLEALTLEQAQRRTADRFPAQRLLLLAQSAHIATLCRNRWTAYRKAKP